jgi:hypothetical protein
MEPNRIELQWKYIYRVGAICVISAALVMIAEILLTLLPDGARVKSTLPELFELYDRNWFMAMRYMGLMNIFATTLMIPFFFSLYGIHRETHNVYGALLLMIYIAGYTIFMADNSSFALLELSRKYEAATSEIVKSSLLSAGEAMFAKGASHTPGTFPGFFIGELASILFCVIMLNGRIFTRITAVIGLAGFSFLFLFEVCSSFIPSLYDVSMIFAMLGGISIIIWYVMVGLKLFKVQRHLVA